MTAYVARDVTHLGVDRIATSPTAFALYENLLAAFQGDATAVAAGVQIQTPALSDSAVTDPKLADGAVSQAKLADGAVSQAKLKTTTASGNTSSITSGSSGTYTLTGGTYSWWTAGGSQDFAFNQSDTAAGVIGVRNVGAGSGQFLVDERYVQASPPYNLGNGDIPLFVLALVDSLGNIKAVSVAPDPIWANNGPTDIRPERLDAQGRAFRRFRTLNGQRFADAVKDPSILRAYMTGALQAEFAELEITQSVKNADMNLFPHPWIGNDLTGLTAVILDPLAPLMNRLAVLHEEEGARAVRRFIESGRVNIGNTPLSMNAPSGLMPVSATWR